MLERVDLQGSKEEKDPPGINSPSLRRPSEAEPSACKLAFSS